jgi:predicted RNA-binding protein YlxR (DUF448 family)
MPIRSCIICKQKKEKKDLFRIVSLNNKAYYDKNQTENVRGIYICKDKKCTDKLLQIVNKGKIKFKIDLDNESLKNVIEVLKIEMGD